MASVTFSRTQSLESGHVIRARGVNPGYFRVVRRENDYTLTIAPITWWSYHWTNMKSFFHRLLGGK